METRRGRGRWWWSLRHTGSAPDRCRGDRGHRAGERWRSRLAQSRRRCASPAIRWHRPAWSAPLTAEAHVIKLAADGAQARFDVAQALAVGQLGERHGEILIPAGQIFAVAITRIASDALLELLVRKE